MSAMDDLRQLANRQPGIATYPQMLGTDPVRPWRTPADLPMPVRIVAQTPSQPAQDAATAPADPDAGADTADTADTAQTLSAGGATHGTDSLDGYTSMRCMANLDGCDDLACVCTCHIDEPTTGEPPALPEQTGGPDDVPLPSLPDEAHPAGTDPEVAVDKPDDEPAARRWWNRIPWRTR